MVSFTALLLTLAVSVTAAPSRTLVVRQDECATVRAWVAANPQLGCTEMASPPWEECSWCCDEVWDLATAWGGDPPCHEDHNESMCPPGTAGWHCADHQ